MRLRISSGQLEQPMDSFARLDPPLAGVRREVGPLLVAWHFLAELDSMARPLDRLNTARRARA